MIEQYINQVRSSSRLKPMTCLEIGARDGEYTQRLALTFNLAPGNLFLADPDPSHHPTLRRRFPDSTVLRFAVPGLESDLTGEILLNRIAKPIDLCVLKVRGFAFEALSGFGATLGHIGTMLVQCEHTELFGARRLCGDVSNLLERTGYQMMAFRYAHSDRCHSTWIRKDLLERAP